VIENSKVRDRYPSVKLEVPPSHTPRQRHPGMRCIGLKLVCEDGSV
jgi:hypothetical protein